MTNDVLSVPVTLTVGQDRELRNSRLCNVIAWATFVTVTAAVTVMLLDQALGLFGKKLFYCDNAHASRKFATIRS